MNDCLINIRLTFTSIVNLGNNTSNGENDPTLHLTMNDAMSCNGHCMQNMKASCHCYINTILQLFYAFPLSMKRHRKKLTML